MRRALVILQIFIAAILTLSSHVARADAPSGIRVALAGVGIGNRPFVGGSSLSVVHARGLLEEEFKKDNIKIQWSFFKGAGPAVNDWPEFDANGKVKHPGRP